MLGKNKNKSQATTTQVPNRVDPVDVPITTEETQQYEIIKMSPNEIQEIIQANLGPEGFGIEDLDVVKIPSGGGTVWEIPTDEGIEPTTKLEGIIIGSKGARAYWKTSYDDPNRKKNEPPDCFSSDLLTGIGEPGGECAACPFNEFGTDKNERGKACRESKRIFLMRRDQIIPLIVRASPMSLKPAKKYMIRLLGSKRHISSVYTRLTLEKVEDVNEYSRIIFTKIGDVEDPERAKEFAKSLEPKLHRAAEQDLRQRDDD